MMETTKIINTSEVIETVPVTEKKESKKRVHRVGAITSGITLLSFGTALFVHFVFGLMEFKQIMNLWPVALIGFGTEMIISCFSKREYKYDIGAVIIMILVIFMSYSIGGVDIILNYIHD